MAIKTPVTEQSEFVAYAVGICHASVCTSLTPEEAAARLNKQHPTGISSQWSLSPAEYFNGGEKLGEQGKNGCQCPDHATNKHYLMHC